MFRFLKTPLSIFFQTKTMKHKNLSSSYVRFLSKNIFNLNPNIYKSFSSQQKEPTIGQPEISTEAQLQKFYQDYLSKKDEAIMAQFDPKDLLGVLYNLATLTHQKGEFNEAEKLFKECLELGNEKNVKNNYWVRAINNLGSLLLAQGKYDEALDYLLQGKKAMETLNLENVDHIWERNMFTRSIVHMNMGQPDIAKELLNDLLQMNEKSPVESLRQFVTVPYKELGYIYLEEGNNSKAIEIWQRGIEFIKKHYGEGAPGVSGLYRGLSDAYMEGQTQEESSQAIAYFHKHIDAKNKEGALDMFDIYELSVRMSIAGDDEGVLKFGKKFLEFARDHDDLRGHRMDVSTIMAIANYRLNNKEEAIAQFNETIAFAKSHFGPNSDEVIYSYFQWLQAIPNEIKMIDEHLEEMVKIAEACKEKSDINKSYYVNFVYWIGNSFIFKDDATRANKYFEECIKLNAEELFGVPSLEKLYHLLSLTHAHLQNYDLAISYAQKGKKLLHDTNGSQESISSFDNAIELIEEEQKKN